MVEVAELDGRGLVGAHASLGLLAALLAGPATRVPAGPQVDEPRDVGGGQQPAVGGVLQRQGEQRPLGAAPVDGERDHAEEGGEHQGAVDDEEVTGARQRRGVPQPVQEGGDDEARQRREQSQPQLPRRDGQPDPDADEDGEERVRERADQAAQDEGAGEGGRATRTEAVGAVVGRGEVEDVLGEGEPDADHAGVDDAVEHAVELVAAPPQEQQQEGALGRLLGDRGDHGEAVALAGPAGDAESLEDEGGRGGHERAPQQARDEQVARLGLVAVEPHEAADQRADGHRGEDGRESERARCAGEADDQGHRQAAEQDQDAHHDGEGNTVATSPMHAPTLTEQRRPAPIRRTPSEVRRRPRRPPRERRTVAG